MTIGSAFPFDRLIRAMDAWATGTGRGAEVLMQIGKGRYRPAGTEWCDSLPEHEFAATVARASLVVSHAGMGSVITALRHSKPIVMLPRRHDLGEHTTDHQAATARWLAAKTGVFVAWETDELAARIREAEAWTGTGSALPPHAPSFFTDRLRAQIEEWTGARRH